MKHARRKSNKPKLGSGARFRALVADLRYRRPDVENPGALAAWIGRRKYGKKKFQKIARAGKRRRSGR